MNTGSEALYGKRRPPLHQQLQLLMNADAAYAYCRRLARSHYENFPVASLALPARLRDPVSAIYAFARTADDIADEGDLTDAERLAGLTELQQRLDALADGDPAGEDPIFVALDHARRHHGITLEPLYELLTAFRMDVTKKRYADFGEVMEYCRYSANPVGRLMLQLFGAENPRHLAWSDAVCSALQLINFLQDIAQDYHEKGRIYLPQDEMARFGATEEHLRDRRNDAAMRNLMAFQAERAEGLLRSGAPLGEALPGRIGLELRLIVQGGLRIVQALRANTDAFARPRLTLRDRLWMLRHALIPGGGPKLSPRI